MQCLAITASTKAQCKRKATPGSQFCSQHKNYSGPLATGNINVVAGAPEAKIDLTTPLSISVISSKPEINISPKSEIKSEIKEGKEMYGTYLELDGVADGTIDGELEIELFEDVDVTIDGNIDISPTLEDDELMEQVVGKGGIMILLPVGEDPVAIQKVLYYDQHWIQITMSQILLDIIAEYNVDATTELAELETKAIELGEDEILGSLIELKDDKEGDTIKLYELNFGYISFKGFEEIESGIYKVLLDFID
jgi:hypothetical protein